MPIDLKDKFFHVVYDYRYLAAAGCAWNDLGPSGKQADTEAANALAPGVAVLIQDSLLLHARSLIDFYTNTHPNHADDIVLSQFTDVTIGTTTIASVSTYKKPIEKHVLHLTDRRDTDYRNLNPDSTLDRPDWNVINPVIVKSLLDALNDLTPTVPSTDGWHKAFLALHDASVKRYNDRAFDWPKELSEKADAAAYLTGLGL